MNTRVTFTRKSWSCVLKNALSPSGVPRWYILCVAASVWKPPAPVCVCLCVFIYAFVDILRTRARIQVAPSNICLASRIHVAHVDSDITEKSAPWYGYFFFYCRIQNFFEPDMRISGSSHRRSDAAVMKYHGSFCVISIHALHLLTLHSHRKQCAREMRVFACLVYENIVCGRNRSGWFLTSRRIRDLRRDRERVCLLIMRKA